MRAAHAPRAPSTDRNQSIDVTRPERSARGRLRASRAFTTLAGSESTSVHFATLSKLQDTEAQLISISRFV